MSFLSSLLRHFCPVFSPLGPSYPLGSPPQPCGILPFDPLKREFHDARILTSNIVFVCSPYGAGVIVSGSCCCSIISSSRVLKTSQFTVSVSLVLLTVVFSLIPKQDILVVA